MLCKALHNIHALVPEMIYDPVNDCIKPFHHFNFTSLRKTWQYELNHLLKKQFGKYFVPYANKSYIDQDKGFYVYARAARDDPETSSRSYSTDVAGCVSYMMRYAARPAMAESRLVSYDKKTKTVAWYYNDHKTEKRDDTDG